MAVKKNVEVAPAPAVIAAAETTPMVAAPKVAAPAVVAPAIVASAIVVPEAPVAGATDQAVPEVVAMKAAAAAPESVATTKPAALSISAPVTIPQTMEKAMKTAEDFVSFGQANADAFVKASQIWATGLQDIGKQFAATAQAQMDQTVATFKALSGVKSMKDALELQTTLARTSVEKAVAETTKLTDASLKLTEQAFAPITARLTQAMETFGRAA